MASFGDFAGGLAAHATEPIELKGLSESVGLADTALKSWTGAVQQSLAPFTELTEWASHFTEAIDPALVRELGRAFRDLQAVIGQAARPIVDEAREIVRYIGGTLMPIMRKLAPIVDELSQKIGQGLKTAISELSDIFEEVEPYLEDIRDVLGGIIDIIHDVSQSLTAFASVGLQAVKDVFQMLIGTGGEAGRTVKDLMREVREAVQAAIKAVLVFAATVMKAAGWTKGVDALVGALERGAKGAKQAEDDRGMAVAQNAMFKSIADLGKSITLSAYQASAFGEKKQDPAAESAKWLEGIAGDIKGLPDQETLQEMFEQMVDSVEKKVVDYGEKKWGEVNDIVNREIRDAKSAMSGYVTRQYNDAIRWIGGKLDWLGSKLNPFS